MPLKSTSWMFALGPVHLTICPIRWFIRLVLHCQGKGSLNHSGLLYQLASTCIPLKVCAQEKTVQCNIYCLWLTVSRTQWSITPPTLNIAVGDYYRKEWCIRHVQSNVVLVWACFTAMLLHDTSFGKVGLSLHEMVQEVFKCKFMPRHVAICVIPSWMRSSESLATRGS